MNPLSFQVEKKIPGALGRAGVLHTSHGLIGTPAFVPVGTKATVKAITPEQLKSVGAEAVLANTYHLYLQPGASLVKAHGGVGRFMRWDGPTFTDSGGFQVFSLGVAFGKGISKFAPEKKDQILEEREDEETEHVKLAEVSEEGVVFRSHIDGSVHTFTPESSIEIQHDLGADIIFAFDEFVRPDAPLPEHRRATERTHRWAKRSLDAHRSLTALNSQPQALFGIVQGGRSEELRRESAQTLAGMAFDGFGIGGTFTKADLVEALQWVSEILPEGKPRHLLGIGEPEDLFIGVENGMDTFDCVAPTRMGRNGSLYTKTGKINIGNAQFATRLEPIEKDCDCYTCAHFSAAYVAHLFRAKEMLAATLATIHNLRFIMRLMQEMRKAIVKGTFHHYRDEFLRHYHKG